MEDPRLENRVSKLEAGLQSLTDNVNKLTDTLSREFQRIHEAMMRNQKTPWPAIFAGLTITVAVLIWAATQLNEPNKVHHYYLQKQVDELRKSYAE